MLLLKSANKTCGFQIQNTLLLFDACTILQLIQLVRDTHEFKEVARLYERTMNHPIKSIQRIQNLDLWEFFCRYR